MSCWSRSSPVVFVGLQLTICCNKLHIFGDKNSPKMQLKFLLLVCNTDLWGNVAGLCGQLGPWLQACEPEAAPSSRPGAEETWRMCCCPSSSPSLHLYSSPNTVVHEYGWRARLPGIINVPQAHINHITIKPPNALTEKVTTSWSQEDK